MAESKIQGQSVESVNITPVSTVLLYGEKTECVRAGKTVQITFWENQAVATSGIVLQNVPKAKTNCTALITKGGANSYETLGTVYIEKGTTNVHIFCKATRTPFYGQLTYVCE